MRENKRKGKEKNFDNLFLASISFKCHLFSNAVLFLCRAHKRNKKKKPKWEFTATVDFFFVFNIRLKSPFSYFYLNTIFLSHALFFPMLSFFSCFFFVCFVAIFVLLNSCHVYVCEGILPIAWMKVLVIEKHKFYLSSFQRVCVCVCLVCIFRSEWARTLVKERLNVCYCYLGHKIKLMKDKLRFINFLMARKGKL